MKFGQLIKLGQLIEYNKRNILDKSFAKSGEETISRLFSKKSKLNMSLCHLFKFLYTLFSLYAMLRAIEIYWN